MHLKVGKDANPKPTYFGAGVGSGFRWNLLGGSALLCAYFMFSAAHWRSSLNCAALTSRLHPCHTFVTVVSQVYVLSASA